MALDLNVKVFPRIEAHLLEAQLQGWLDQHGDVVVRFITQSENCVGSAQHVTVSIFYTKPTVRERALQAHMRGQDAE